MRTLPLGELIRPATLVRAGGNDYPLLSMTMHDGLVAQSAKFKKRVASGDTAAYKVVSRGQLVVGFPIDEAVLDFLETPSCGIVSPAYGIWDIAPGVEVHRPYLNRFLRSPEAIRFYKARLRGSTARRRSLPNEVFLELPVPFPPLEEQRRIAAILDQADALRAKRRQVLAHLGALTQSIFHDMFCRRSEQWPAKTLGEICPRIDSGKSPVCEPRPALSGEWGVLKLGAVTYGVFAPSENKAFLGSVTDMLENRVLAGDVLMTRKNTRDLVGAVALVPSTFQEDLLLPDLIFRLHLNTSIVDPRYFQALMMSSEKRAAVQNLSSGSAASMPNISKRRLSSLPIELPPLPLQRQFAEAAGRLDEARLEQARAAASGDELFVSLQSRAFRGEL